MNISYRDERVRISSLHFSFIGFYVGAVEAHCCQRHYKRRIVRAYIDVLILGNNLLHS